MLLAPRLEKGQEEGGNDHLHGVVHDGRQRELSERGLLMLKDERNNGDGHAFRLLRPNEGEGDAARRRECAPCAPREEQHDEMNCEDPAGQTGKGCHA